MTDIQALVLGVRKECSWRKLAAGDTTVGSTPTFGEPITYAVQTENICAQGSLRTEGWMERAGYQEYRAGRS